MIGFLSKTTLSACYHKHNGAFSFFDGLSGQTVFVLNVLFHEVPIDTVVHAHLIERNYVGISDRTHWEWERCERWGLKLEMTCRLQNTLES